MDSEREGRGGPVRTCVGCRQRATTSELLRVTVGRDAQGREVVAPDPHHTASGRGAHLHPTPDCFDLAERRRAFPRALRVPPGTLLGLDELRRHLTDMTE